MAFEGIDLHDPETGQERLFGRPVAPCSSAAPHDWHGDGGTYCLGVK